MHFPKCCQKKGFMLLTETNHKEYMQHLLDYQKITKDIGSVYTSQSKAYIIEDKKKRIWQVDELE